MGDSVRIGRPTTVGRLRDMLCCFTDDTRLAVRNGPLPTLRYLMIDGEGFVEVDIEIPAPDPARREEEMSRAFKPYTDMEKIACDIGYHFWHPDSRYHAWQLGKDAAREVMSWLKSPDSDDAFPDEPTPSTGDQQSRGGDAT